VTFPNFQNRIINTIASIWPKNMLRYYFVLTHYLFLKAHSFCCATLLENCSLLETDNVHRQISEHIYAANGGYCYTVEPLLSTSPLLLSSQPLFSSQRPKFQKYCQLYTVIKTSIQQAPLLSSCGQLLAIPRVILFCFISQLNGQEDLKLDVFSQMKVKEWQWGT